MKDCCADMYHYFKQSFWTMKMVVHAHTDTHSVPGYKWIEHVGPDADLILYHSVIFFVSNKSRWTDVALGTSMWSP